MIFDQQTHKPRCSVSFEGGVLEDSDSRFVSCTIDDHAGTQNDTVEIVMANAPYVAYPAMQTEFSVKLGFGNDLVVMGNFIIDEIEDHGPPDVVTIRGHAIDTDSSWKEPRFKEYSPKEFKTIGDIATEVITRNGGRPIIDPFFFNTKNPYVAQRNASDTDFLTKLGDLYGGILKPLIGHIYFIRKGEDSEEAPSFEIRKKQVKDHSYLNQGRSAFGIVVGRWRDMNTGTETAISLQTGLQSKNVYVMPKIYSTAEAARGAAFAQGLAFQASKETFNFGIYGIPGMVAQSKIKAIGFHPQMPSEWRVLQVSHTLAKGSGYTTQAVCEIPKNAATGVADSGAPDNSRP